jgi:hypothetical protein
MKAQRRKEKQLVSGESSAEPSPEHRLDKMDGLDYIGRIG